MNNSQEIAKRIKAQAKAKGCSVNEVLTACELGRNTITKISNGSDIYAGNLARIADYLDCSVDYLLGNTDDPTAPGKIKKLPASGGELAEEALDRELIARLCSLSAEELARVDAFVQGLLASR